MCHLRQVIKTNSKMLAIRKRFDAQTYLQEVKDSIRTKDDWVGWRPWKITAGLVIGIIEADATKLETTFKEHQQEDLEPAVAEEVCA